MQGLKIKQAAVLGAGTMGAQIAAHLSAAGVKVFLLDMPTNEEIKDAKGNKIPGGKSARVYAALESLKNLKPSPLFSTDLLEQIIPGNFEEDLSVIASCDLVLEAIVEKLEPKVELFNKVCAYAKPTCILATNTSGISISSIAEKIPEHFRSQLVGIHFFNPPRYLHLVEIIATTFTQKELASSLGDWIEKTLGKGVVQAKDTINFIANRIGTFSLQYMMWEMDKFHLNLESVDALTGKLIGRSNSACFRTMDVVGLDVFAHVTKNVIDHVKTDPYYDYFKTTPWIQELIQNKQLGQKTGGIGCYKKIKMKDGRTEILSYRPSKKDYENSEVVSPSWLSSASKIESLEKRIQYILEQKDEAAIFIWKVLASTWSYVSLLMDEIAGGNPKSVDNAMKWGFAWEEGPFALWQKVGLAPTLKRMKDEGFKIPAWLNEVDTKTFKFFDEENHKIFDLKSNSLKSVPKNSQIIDLPRSSEEAKLYKNVVYSNKAASLVDIGDGVACLALHSKFNTIGEASLEALDKTIEEVHKNFGALVLGTAHEHFSAGADLKNLSVLIEKKSWNEIDTLVKNFQATLQKLKFASFPSIACVKGMTFGGGCELALHSSRQLLHSESYCGLVEIGVGLLPAGGGCKELALQAYENASLGNADTFSFVQSAFQNIAMGKTSSSSLEAISMGLFSKSRSRSTMSVAHQLYRAKMWALNEIELGYTAPKVQMKIKVLGDPGFQTLSMMMLNMKAGNFISEHDAKIAGHIAEVLCGGQIDGGSFVSESQFLLLERKRFVELCQQEKSIARIQSMLTTGKALRN